MSEEVAVITGGASGFGLALGARCAERGLRVVLLDRDGDRAVNEAAALAVADPHALQAAADDVVERFGGADVVVSNVGVQLFGSAEELTDDEWRWLLDLNVIGAARTARAFLPQLRKATRGRLAFTTSSSVLSPASRMAAYQASKFAVWGLARPSDSSWRPTASQSPSSSRRGCCHATSERVRAPSRLTCVAPSEARATSRR